MTSHWQAVWAAADGWIRVALVAVLVAAVAQTTFIAIYATRPWWKVRVGRAIFLKSLALAVILDLSVVNDFLTYRYQEQISALAILFIAVTILYQLFALVRSPRNLGAPARKEVKS